MASIVVDANVAVKWLELFAKESLVREANQLLARRVNLAVEMLVPDLFWPEVGSILWKAVRRNECTQEDARASLSLLEDLHLQTVPSGSFIAPALEIAIRYGRSVYDSVYVAVARELGLELVTADEKLANALTGHLPVKWLGAI